MTISSLNNFATNLPSSSSQGLPGAKGQTSVDTLVSLNLESLRRVDTQGMSYEEKRQTALQVVNKTLSMAYEKIASKGQAAAEEYATFEPLTAEKVANNILGFIERRLQMDVAEGATQEELQTRLEAGLSGFKKGFAEASEKLEALSLLSPEIKTDIGKTYDLVIAGVDELRAKFIESTTAEPTAGSEAGVVKNQPTASAEQVTPNLKSSAKAAPLSLEVPAFIPAPSSYLGYANYEYGRAREFSFELTTKEGDKVTIKAASSEGLAVEAGRAGRGNESVSAMNASYSASQSFSLSIEGDLSEAELVAINDLLGRVNNLADQFFTGDLDGAFAQAMELGYDSSQIGSFALNLAQAEIQQVTKAYEAFEPSTAGNGNKFGLNNDSLLPLGNFIRDLLDSLDRASVFAEPEKLLTNIAEKMPDETTGDQTQAHRFSGFMKQIFALELS
ncbi:DUF5610 domain-containing protein [Cellvibrio fontiphilus]|uniref:DUF5610 domain-containing protein n=1 Tax=Cellvibrio fontiphilus TaxID=1815559 RepID=A0ABV7FF78_9GAMM